MPTSCNDLAATRAASQQYNMSTTMQYLMQNQMETLKATTSVYNPLLTITPKKDRWSKLIEQAKNDHREVEDELLIHLDDVKKVEVGNSQNGGQIDEDDYISENEMTHQITTAMHKKPCFLFAGAGISMAAPSSAPSWWKLMSDVLEETLKAVPDELQHIAEKLRTTDSYRRPEEVMETYYFILGDKLFDVFKLLNQGRPNTNHKTIAKMAKEGKLCTILTTNFDEFIEQSLDEEDIEYKVICTNEEYKEYFENGCEEFAVLKIHGTVSRPETIIAVASHYKTSGGFDGYKSSVAQYFVKTFPTIFFGYSGWDFAHANYQEFWDAAGRVVGGENIYFTRRTGSTGGPLLSKLVGRHVGDRLVIGEGDLPLTAISIFKSFNPHDAEKLLQLHNESTGMSHKAIQEKQREYIRSWVHEIPTVSLLAIVWNESIYLNEGTNLRLEKTRQRRVKKDSAASMISIAETDSITAYLMDLSTKLAQGKITNKEFTEKQNRATIELGLAPLMVSKRKKDKLINLCVETFKKNSLLIGSQDYQSLLPSYVFSIADVADDSTTPIEIINAAIEYIVKVLDPLRMKIDDDEKSKILYELYQTQINFLRISEEERKDIHDLFTQFADEAIEQKWSEEERRNRSLEYITPVVNRVAYHQIDTQAIVRSMVNYVMKLNKDGKDGTENIAKSSRILALSLHKQAAFLTSDLYRLDEVQKLIQMFSMDVNKKIPDVYYEEVEEKMNKITQPLLDLLKSLKKKQKPKYRYHNMLLEEVLGTFELANAEILRLLFKNSSTLLSDELRRESCGYYPRDTLPPSVATYLSTKTLNVSKHIRDERGQQACLGMLCVLGESSNNVNQMRLAVDKSMVFTEGKVTETTPCPIPEALAAQYQEEGNFKDALQYYKLALEGIRTFVPRQKTDAIVLNACLVQAQYDTKEALKMAFEFSPFFNEIQLYSIVGPARGILVQQSTAWASEFGLSLEDAIDKFMHEEDKEDIEENDATSLGNTAEEILEDDNRQGRRITKKKTIARHLPMGGGEKKAIQGTNTCGNCIII